MNTKKAVCGLLFNNNKILAVSRKNNRSDFNLFGGKIESGGIFGDGSSKCEDCKEEL